jgi:hypothetical protein
MKRNMAHPDGYKGVRRLTNGFFEAAVGGRVLGAYRTDILAAIAVQDALGNAYEAARLRKLNEMILKGTTAQ